MPHDYDPPLVLADELAVDVAFPYAGALEDGDEEKALEHGCDGYLAKPFMPKSVVDIVEKFIKAAE